eukprot:scaffold3713_cov372-Prasinococcus_capsulatus_cf.AAC.27
MGSQGGLAGLHNVTFRADLSPWERRELASRHQPGQAGLLWRSVTQNLHPMAVRALDISRSARPTASSRRDVRGCSRLGDRPPFLRPTVGRATTPGPRHASGVRDAAFLQRCEQIRIPERHLRRQGRAVPLSCCEQPNLSASEPDTPLDPPDGQKLGAADATSEEQSTALYPLVRSLTLADTWPAASIHCSAFFANSPKYQFDLLRLFLLFDLFLTYNAQRANPNFQTKTLVYIEEPDDKTAENSASWRTPPCPSFTRNSIGKLFPKNTEAALPFSPTKTISTSLSGLVKVDLFTAAGIPLEEGKDAGRSAGLMQELIPVPVPAVRAASESGVVGYISNLAVRPARRRRGIAKKLMEDSEAIARSWGCKGMGPRYYMFMSKSDA